MGCDGQLFPYAEVAVRECQDFSAGDLLKLLELL